MPRDKNIVVIWPGKKEYLSGKDAQDYLNEICVLNKEISHMEKEILRKLKLYRRGDNGGLIQR